MKTNMDINDLLKCLRRQIEESNSISYSYTLELLKELDERLTNGETPPSDWNPKCEYCNCTRLITYVCSQCVEKDILCL
jgi:hypothetical protein